MNRLLSLAVLMGGVVLIVVGINVTQTFSTAILRNETGSPVDKAVLMLIGGSLMSVIGVTVIVRTTKKI